MKRVAMRTMKMRRSCRRLDGQVQCGGNDGGGLRGILGSRIRSQTIPDHTTVIIRHELSPYLNLRTDEACVMPLLVTIVTELV